ncbi:hypothetical protein [Mucilaginibacter antarcticus]|uniref:Uncharacterized protein n=1 Tax=Mucilaginibacter antarcticus TaxID=1855725 RepID=A0ABW5XUI6_9SPHI
MEQQTEAMLTGTDGPVSGTITHITYGEHRNAYRFDSVDNTLHLVVIPNDTGNWQRIAGSEPYLSGWVDELAEQIAKIRS